MKLLHKLMGETAVAGALPVSEHLMLIDPKLMQRALSATAPEVAMVGECAASPLREMAAEGVPVDVIGRTAVVPVVGMTNKRFQAAGFIASYNAISLAVNAAVADKQIDSIMLHIDSPGGYVSGIASVADDIHKAAQQKHVVAQVDGLGASAAYWIASQANEIVAGRLDVVGSIGVMTAIYDVSKLFAEAGIKTEVFSTGKFKTAGLEGTSLTDEQRKEIQSEVDALGDAFVADIVRGRAMDEKAVRAVADGRVFQASEAVSNGLIDGIATPQETLQRLNASSARRGKMRNARLEVAQSGM